MQRNLVARATKDVINLLGISPEKLFELQVEIGCGYLDQYYQGFGQFREAARDTSAYWEWWQSVWASRDHALLASLDVIDDQVHVIATERGEGPFPFQIIDSVAFYTAYHAGRMAFGLVYPNDLVEREINKTYFKSLSTNENG